MTGHLIWPVSLLGMVLALRKTFLRLVNSISSIKHADTEVVFENKAAEVRAAIRADQEPANIGVTSVGASPTSEIGQVVMAWNDLEQVLRTRLASLGGIHDAKSVTSLMPEAVRAGLLTQDQANAVHGLRVMRNLAVHGPPIETDSEKVRDFLLLADAVKTLLSITK